MTEHEPAECGDPAETAGSEAADRSSDGFESLAKAAAASSIAKAETSVLSALGGVWGIVTSILPVLLFVTVFTITDDLKTTLIASVAAGVVILLVSLIMRRPISQSIGGLLGVLVCALVARSTGRSEDFFAIGLLANLGYASAMAVSIFMKYPLIGIFVQALKFSEKTSGKFFAWREDQALLRRYCWLTWLWVALFAARLLVQTPLYLAGMTTYLGTAKLVMGLPLTAIVLWMSWLIVRKSAKD